MELHHIWHLIKYGGAFSIGGIVLAALFLHPNCERISTAPLGDGSVYNCHYFAGEKNVIVLANPFQPGSGSSWATRA